MSGHVRTALAVLGLALLLNCMSLTVWATEAHGRPVSQLALCPSELGEHARCVWDGRHMGDRRGPSFVTQGVHVDGVFVIERVRISHKRAHRIARRVLCREYAWRCER